MTLALSFVAALMLTAGIYAIIRHVPAAGAALIMVALLALAAGAFNLAS
jgi:hypothetical protein